MFELCLLKKFRMSTKYYFEKWTNVLTKLEELISIDLEYQETNAKDKKWCEAVQRLTGMLGHYIFFYNEITDCYNHNIQVQKTVYIKEIIQAVIARILELKNQLRKIVASDYQFLGNGLINHKLTTNEVELLEIPAKDERQDNVKILVLEAIEKAEHRKEKKSIIELKEPEEKISNKINWWDDNNTEDTVKDNHKGINVTAVYELRKKEEVTIEMMESTNMLILIQSHERLRKIIFQVTQQKQRIDRWKKELAGILLPPARREIRERSAKFIQRICRAYFEAKRRKVIECKRDEMLNLRLCDKLRQKYQDRSEDEFNENYMKKLQDYEKQWHESCAKMKQSYIKKRHREVEDDIRDEIMNWFHYWFMEVIFFHDMPKEDQGGSTLIVKEEILSPEEWLEKYEVYLEEKRKNKNKTSYELKIAKLEAKKEKLMEKKAEHLKKKMEDKLLKKMMKNPNYHPGYQYPKSKHTKHIFTAIQKYQKDWSDLDHWETPGVKEKFVFDVDVSDAVMNAKMEIRKEVDEDMREILRTLRNALKIDYERNGEEMPEMINERKIKRRKGRNRGIKVTDIKDVEDRLEALALKGFLKGFSTTKIEDFIGDPNFAGDELRCMLQPVQAFGGETRALWWEKCRELTLRAQRILLVGPKGSGKSTLVWALASMNNAVVFDIDPGSLPEEFFSTVYLQQLATSIFICARATQPSVIFIRHLHRLFYRKFPPEEDEENLNLIKRYLLRTLLKKIKKTDKITVVASCIDPWLANSKQMLKLFPTILLLPELNYSAVSIILRNWVLDNHVIPKDLNIQSLAYVLRGYTFGHIKDTLATFLTADRIIKIAAYGLSIDEIYNYFLDGNEEKIDYSKYIKWYTEKSHWGKREMKLLQEQKEFQRLLEEMQEKKNKKKKKKAIVNSTPSGVSVDTEV